MTDDIVEEAAELLEQSQNGWRNIYDAAEEDLDFYLGGDKQWGDGSAAGRRPAQPVAITDQRPPHVVHPEVRHENVSKKMTRDAKEESFDSHYILKNAASFSADDKYITIAEFFKQEAKRVKILQLANGLVVLADQYGKLPDQPQVLAERMI